MQIDFRLPILKGLEKGLSYHQRIGKGNKRKRWGIRNKLFGTSAFSVHMSAKYMAGRELHLLNPLSVRPPPLSALGKDPTG